MPIFVFEMEFFSLQAYEVQGRTEYDGQGTTNLKMESREGNCENTESFSACHTNQEKKKLA